MHERRFTGFNDQIITLSARDMTAREIQGFTLDLYATIYRADSNLKCNTCHRLRFADVVTSFVLPAAST